MIKIIKKRRICVITGTRAEYGLLKPIMMAIHEKDDLEIFIVVAGMHLSKKFGYSFKEIVKDWKVVSSIVPMDSQDDNGSDMALSISKGIKGMIKAFKEIKPTFIVILGDRTEAFAAAIAAAYMNIPIAHIHGGDKSKAGLDESVRHAITKLAYVHFAATRLSAERILKMGEDKKRVFVVGAPGLDNIINQKLYSLNELKQRFKIDDKGYLLLLQHSVTTQPEQAKGQIIETMNAITELKVNSIVIYPNSDAGGRQIIKVLQKYKNNPLIQLYKNLDNKTFLSLMKHALAIVGNSSSGIIESPSFKIPAVNVGIRQEGRERTKNVIDVPHNKELIKEAIKKALNKKFIKSIQHITSPYGKGNASTKIATLLATIPLNKDMIQKTITY